MYYNLTYTFDARQRLQSKQLYDQQLLSNDCKQETLRGNGRSTATEECSILGLSRDLITRATGASMSVKTARVTHQKEIIFIITTVRISNLTWA